jgi:hypothetical protein
MPTIEKIVLAFALLVSLAFAGQTTPVHTESTPVHKLPEQLALEKWFVGNWNCVGKQHASPMSPAVSFTDKFSFKMVLDGSWLTYHIDQIQGPHKGKRTLIGWGTWDANAKLHIRRDMNLGGSRLDMTTPGWDGDTLVFTGNMIAGDEKLSVKQTFKMESDSAYDSALVVTGAEGNPVEWEEESCKKVGK